MSKKIVEAATAGAFGLISKQINATSKSVSLIKHSGVIPGGFPYSAYNGGANVRPECLMHVVETTRNAALFKSPTPLTESHKLYNEYFIFINASTMQVDPKLYDHTICKGPLYFDVELDHVGTKSFSLKTSFFAEGISDPLFVSNVASVFVCNKTRVPKAAPDWWIQTYKGLVEENKDKDGGGGQSTRHLDFSDGDESKSTTCQFQVWPSDCDTYRHTNWSHYIRYCQDTFGQHQIAMKGVAGFEDSFRRGVRCFSILYKKESSVGDLLTVTLSPQKAGDKEEDIFFFRVENEAKDLIVQSKIEYYPFV